ncbi:hypothetical protein DSECCO2_221280 [anaerobic digester metagenome]
MPRAPNEKIEQAKELFDKGKKMVDIAAALKIPEGTIRSWKKRYNWGATLQNKKRNVAKKKGAQPGNNNATGGPPGNKKAEKHGFFAKWLPAETMEIMNCIEHSDPIDLLWDNIQLQYAAIIRAQNLMYVRDQEDKTIEKVGSSAGKVSSQTWEIQQAWDKHANFLQAQSRAMKTLESMIKQYDDLTRSSMVTEEQRARIDKLKCEVAKLSGGSETFEDDGFIEALKGNIAEVWADDSDD